MAMSDLPQSPTLLAEADPEWSLAELFTRDPLEVYKKTPDQFRRLIEEIRAQALRNAAAEAAGERIPRSPKASAAPLPAKIDQKLEDLF